MDQSAICEFILGMISGGSNSFFILFKLFVPVTGFRSDLPLPLA